MTHWFIDRVASHGARPAFVDGDARLTHAEVAASASGWQKRLISDGVCAGDVVVVVSDHSPMAFAAMLALAALRAVFVPLTPLPATIEADRCAVAGAQWVLRLMDSPQGVLECLEPPGTPPLIQDLRARERAGLILFSSGSSGAPKACLLDLDSLLDTTRTQRRGWTSLAFLLFDHIGGINTVIGLLGHGGTAVLVHDRSVGSVCEAIETHKVALLPTSPTFLKMLLIADAPSAYDLSSLKLITYGTEVMPPTTLAALNSAFPNVRLKQTYGLSEVGIVATRSRADDSLWVEIGGEGVETKVVNDILFVRAPTAMLGYLNAPSPFDAEGWFDTNDRVDVDGPYFKILGRESELINVGGEKVHPSEVESVLLDAENVLDVTVEGRPNPVMGTVVAATVRLVHEEGARDLRTRLTAFCRTRLEPHKVPMSFRISADPLHSDRFKKVRTKTA